MNYDRMQASTHNQFLSMQNCASVDTVAICSMAKVKEALDAAQAMANDVISLASELAGPAHETREPASESGNPHGVMPSLAYDAEVTQRIMSDARAAISRIRRQF